MIVSKGAQKKTVPDVRGKSEADARSEIQAAGLTVGSTSTQHDDSVAKGNVISQSVTPGKKYQPEQPSIWYLAVAAIR